MTQLTRVKAWVHGEITGLRARALTLAKAIGIDTAVHAVGLGLLAYGAFLVYPPAGFIVPGACIVWWTLPARPPFVASPVQKRSRGDTE